MLIHSELQRCSLGSLGLNKNLAHILLEMWLLITIHGGIREGPTRTVFHANTVWEKLDFRPLPNNHSEVSDRTGTKSLSITMDIIQYISRNGNCQLYLSFNDQSIIGNRLGGKHVYLKSIFNLLKYYRHICILILTMTRSHFCLLLLQFLLFSLRKRRCPRTIF